MLHCSDSSKAYEHQELDMVLYRSSQRFRRGIQFHHSLMIQLLALVTKAGMEACQKTLT
jgi:hypothetical protein